MVSITSECRWTRQDVDEPGKTMIKEEWKEMICQSYYQSMLIPKTSFSLLNQGFADSLNLTILWTRAAPGRCNFSVAGPRFCNSLPPNVHSAKYLLTLRWRLLNFYEIHSSCSLSPRLLRLPSWFSTELTLFCLVVTTACYCWALLQWC